MTIHLTKFVDRVVGNRARGAKDFIMSQKDAEDLHADVTRLLLELATLREHAVTSAQDQTITVQMDGGTF
jgi:hypothetical protein